MQDDPKREEAEDTKSASNSQDVSFYELLSYADAMDWTMMALGTLGSAVHGLAQPVGYLLLGKALDAFGNNIHDTKAMVKALEKVNPPFGFTKLFSKIIFIR